MPPPREWDPAPRLLTLPKNQIKLKPPLFIIIHFLSRSPGAVSHPPRPPPFGRTVSSSLVCCSVKVLGGACGTGRHSILTHTHPSAAAINAHPKRSFQIKQKALSENGKQTDIFDFSGKQRNEKEATENANINPLTVDLLYDRVALKLVM